QSVSVEELPFGILELAPDVMNSPFSVSGNFVYRLVVDNWAEAFEIPIDLPVQRIKFTSQEGDMVAYETLGSSGVGVLDRELATWKQYQRNDSGDEFQLSINELNDLTTDDSNRIWVATTWGMNVIDENGEVQIFHSHTSRLPENNILLLVVYGDGPALPQKIETETGIMQGRIFLGDQPLGDSNVALCIGQASVSFLDVTKNPCLDQPYLQSGLTNSEGSFVFENLPQGSYKFFVEKEGVWARVGVLTKYQVKAGDISDFGILTVSEDDFE
ncbi:MAG: hypothetical protein AAGD96_06280, partial [Chloroflexota bacterium]